jgi:hypothetical protein
MLGTDGTQNIGGEGLGIQVTGSVLSDGCSQHSPIRGSCELVIYGEDPG